MSGKCGAHTYPRIGAQWTDQVEARPAVAPAKRTLVEQAAVQLRPAESASNASSCSAPQRAGDWNMTAGLSSALGLGEIANQGVANASAPLPHFEAVQRSFGGHDVSGVRAEVGGAAGEASRAIGAEAYATGNRVGFASAPDLHTAAHEAAHVVQQRHGVQLKGGVGEAGDRYEQHADAVADAVVAGRSAEGLLSELAPGGSVGSAAAVQRKPIAQPFSSTANSYQDDRGSTMMIQVSTNVYAIDSKHFNYYAETDQYLNWQTNEAWDPVSGGTLSMQQGTDGSWWYVAGQLYYYYDGKTYQPYQPEGSYSNVENSYSNVENSYSNVENSYSNVENSYSNVEGSYSNLQGSYQQQSGFSFEGLTEPEQEVDYDQMLQSEAVTLMTAGEMIQAGLKDKAAAIMIIKFTIEPEQVLIYFRSWNAARSSIKDLVEKQSTSTESNKRKHNQSRVPAKPPVFDAITLDECSLTAQGLVERLQLDRQREQRYTESQHTAKKRKRELLAKIEYRDTEFKVEILSEGGGFYDVYTITDEKQIIPGTANNTLVLRIPKDGPNRRLASEGQQTHGQLAKHVDVPQIHNRPSRDGFFLVEKIEHEFNVKRLMTKQSFAACSEQERARLEQVRSVLRNNADAERALVPDFRPTNLRFRTEDSPNVVLVDFTDEAKIGQDTGEKFWQDMKSVVLEFSDYRENHWLYQYLLQGFTKAQESRIVNAEVF